MKLKWSCRPRTAELFCLLYSPQKTYPPPQKNMLTFSVTHSWLPTLWLSVWPPLARCLALEQKASLFPLLLSRAAWKKVVITYLRDSASAETLNSHLFRDSHGPEMNDRWGQKSYFVVHIYSKFKLSMVSMRSSSPTERLTLKATQQQLTSATFKKPKPHNHHSVNLFKILQIQNKLSSKSCGPSCKERKERIALLLFLMILFHYFPSNSVYTEKAIRAEKQKHKKGQKFLLNMWCCNRVQGFCN